MVIALMMGPKIKFLVIFLLASLTLSKQSKKQASRLLQQVKDRNSSESEIESEINGDEEITIIEKRSLKTDENLSFGEKPGIFANVFGEVMNENLEKSTASKHAVEHSKNSEISENIKKSEININLHEVPIPDASIDSAPKSKENVDDKKNSDDSDLIDKVESPITKSKIFHFTNPSLKVPEEFFDANLEGFQDKGDLSNADLDQSKDKDEITREVFIQRLPIVPPIPYFVNIPMMIPLPVENYSSGSEMIPPSTHVSDRLPVPEGLEITSENSALAVAIENNTDRHASETAQEVISQILKSLLGVKLPQPAPIPYLPTLPGSHHQDNVQHQKDSKVIDMFGRKYLMKSKTSQHPIDGRGGLTLKFMSLTPLESPPPQSRKEDEDEWKIVKTVDLKETQTETEKETKLHTNQDTINGENKLGSETANDIFKALEDPYQKMLTKPRPDIMILGSSQVFQTEGSAESTMKEIEEANQQRLEASEMKPEHAAEKSQKVPGTTSLADLFGDMKTEPTHLEGVKKDVSAKHEIFDQVNRKGYVSNESKDTDNLKEEKPTVESAIVGIAKPTEENKHDSFELSDKGDFRSIGKDNVSVTSKEKVIVDQNSKVQESMGIKRNKFEAIDSKNTHEIGSGVLKEVAVPPNFKVDKDLKSKEKDFTLGDKDLYFEDKNLNVKNYDILKKEDVKSKDKDLMLENKDMKSEDKDVIAKNKDTILADSYLKATGEPSVLSLK